MQQTFSRWVWQQQTITDYRLTTTLRSHFKESPDFWNACVESALNSNRLLNKMKVIFTSP